MPQSITIAATINAPLATVWKCYTTPEDIVQWNAASPDWHTTHAENDLRPGGRFLSRMEAKDGSFGFDFGSIYSFHDFCCIWSSQQTRNERSDNL
jgi:uncharacterized protein YndB with AHSA1/START domain